MSFRDRIEQARANLANSEPVGVNDNETKDEDVFESEYFGIENIRNLPACFDLRFADGNRKAIPYSDITEIDYDPSGTIEIVCAEKKIVISGRDLEKLYSYLAVYRVRFIAETVGSGDAGDGLFVERISIDI